MNIITEVKEWQSIRKQLVDKTIGFVATMGNLHLGHLVCAHVQKKKML